MSYTSAALLGYGGGNSYNRAALLGSGIDPVNGVGMKGYTDAALVGYGDESYTNAALRGYGDESYTDAALRGYGSYTTAALEGYGKTKLKKGSPEARERMAYLRSLRGKGRGGGKQSMLGGAFDYILMGKSPGKGRRMYVNDSAADEFVKRLKSAMKNDSPYTFNDPNLQHIIDEARDARVKMNAYYRQYPYKKKPYATLDRLLGPHWSAASRRAPSNLPDNGITLDALKDLLKPRNKQIREDARSKRAKRGGRT